MHIRRADSEKTDVTFHFGTATARQFMLALLTFGVIACAGQHSGSSTTRTASSQNTAGSAADALLKAEEALARAVRRSDFETIERLLAPEFRLLAGGQITARAAWLANLRNIRVDSVALFHVSPHVIGDSAIVSLEWYWRAEVKGRPPIDQTGVLRDTWRFRDEHWVVVQRETLARRPGYAPTSSPPR